jgi:hypothetical protein
MPDDSRRVHEGKLFIDAAGPIRGKGVVEVLQAVAAERGYTKTLSHDTTTYYQ